MAMKVSAGSASRKPVDCRISRTQSETQTLRPSLPYEAIACGSRIPSHTLRLTRCHPSGWSRCVRQLEFARNHDLRTARLVDEPGEAFRRVTAQPAKLPSASPRHLFQCLARARRDVRGLSPACVPAPKPEYVSSGGLRRIATP